MEYIIKNGYQDLLGKYKIVRPIYLTLGFNDHVKFGEGDNTKERMKKNHRHFFNELHRNVFKKSTKRIPRYVVIERGGETSGFHSHVVCETPEHLSTNKFENLLRTSWLKTKDGVSLYAERTIFDRQGLDGYNAKQQCLKDTDAEVDVMNSFTN